MSGTTTQLNQDKQENYMPNKVVGSSSNDNNTSIGIVTWNVNHLGEIKLTKSIASFITYLLENKDFYVEKSTESDLSERIYIWIQIGEKYRRKDEKNDKKKLTGYEYAKTLLAKLIKKVLTEWEINLSESTQKKLEQLYNELSKVKAVNGKQGRKRKIENIYKEIKNDLKKIQLIKQINTFFEKNAWLQVLILQEVNESGIVEIESRLGANLKLVRGPKMLSYNQGQREYYPIIIRDNEIKVKKIFFNDKEFILKEGVETEIEDQDWNKRTGSFRPVILYELLTNGGAIFIGNLHTTPGRGGEFFRQTEYEQIKEGILSAKKIADNSPLIIGGDYYLFRESRVIDPELAIYLGDNLFEKLLYEAAEQAVAEEMDFIDDLQDEFNEQIKKIEEKNLKLVKFTEYYLDLIFMHKFCKNFYQLKNLLDEKVRLSDTGAVGILFEETDFDSLIENRGENAEIEINEFFIHNIHACYNKVINKPSLVPHLKIYIEKDLNKKILETIGLLKTGKEEEGEDEGQKNKKKVRLKEGETIDDRARKLVYDKEFVKSWKEKINALLTYFNMYVKSEKNEEIKNITIDSEFIKNFSYLKFLIQRAKVKKHLPLVKKEGVDVVRSSLKLTFAHEMEKAKVKIAQPVSGSNMHKPTSKDQKSTFYSISRVADFFLYRNTNLLGPEQKQLKNISDMAIAGYIGHLHPDGGIILADNDSLSSSRYWRLISDHFPVAAVFNEKAEEQENILYKESNSENKRKESEEKLNRQRAVLLLVKGISTFAKWSELKWKKSFLVKGKNKNFFLEKLITRYKDICTKNYFYAALESVEMTPLGNGDFEQAININEQIKDIEKELLNTVIPDTSSEKKTTKVKIDNSANYVFGNILGRILHYCLFEKPNPQNKADYICQLLLKPKEKREQKEVEKCFNNLLLLDFNLPDKETIFIYLSEEYEKIYKEKHIWIFQEQKEKRKREVSGLDEEEVVFEEIYFEVPNPYKPPMEKRKKKQESIMPYEDEHIDNNNVSDEDDTIAE